MKQFLFIIIHLFFIINVKSQIGITNIEEIDKVKNGTTYIAMKDPGSTESQAFIAVFKAHWTISEVEFIKYSEIEAYLAPDRSFLTMGGFSTTSQFSSWRGGTYKPGLSYTNTHLYLELWTCKEAFFEPSKKKKKKEFDDSYKTQIARIELFTDFETLSKPENIYETNYDGDGHIRNWGPGILKNYLQLLMSYLNKKEERWLYATNLNNKEVQVLKNNTLYAPDYLLIKMNKFNGDESKRHEEEEIFDKYKLKYQIIPIAELNEKILKDETPFYYLIYLKSSTDKYIVVLNSKTGEMIYSKYVAMSYNIKSDDLEDLHKKVNEKSKK